MLKETAVRLEVARPVCYNSFHFVNNKSDLCDVSVIFFCFVVNFCSDQEMNRKFYRAINRR